MGNTELSAIVNGHKCSDVTGGRKNKFVCGGCYGCDQSKPTTQIDIGKHGPAQEVASAATILSDTSGIVFCAMSDGQVKAWIWIKDKPIESFVSSRQTLDIGCVSIEESRFRNMLDSGCNPLQFCGGSHKGYVYCWELDVMCGMIMPTLGFRAHDQTPAHGQAFAGASAVSLDEDIIVSGGADGELAVWSTQDLPSKAPLRRTPGAHGGAVTATCHSHSGQENDFTLTAGEDGIVKAWSPSASCQLPRHAGEGGANTSNSKKIQANSCYTVRNLVLDMKHARCCAGCDDNGLRLWDLGHFRPTLRFGAPSVNEFHGPGVFSAAFDEVNVSYIASGYSNGSISVWDIRSSCGAGRRPVAKILYHSDPVVSVASHGHMLLAASLDGWATLWDLRGDVNKPLEVITLPGSYGKAPVNVNAIAVAQEHLETPVASNCQARGALRQAERCKKQRSPGLQMPMGDDSNHVAEL